MENYSQEKQIDVQSILEEAYACRVYDLRRSISLAETALQHSKKINDKKLIGKCLNQLALYFMICGEYEKSTELTNEAIIYFEELNDEKGLADAKYNIAGILYKTNNYHLGLSYFIDALSIYWKFNDFHNISRVEKSLGTIYEYFGDMNNAVRSYEKAIDAAKKAGDHNLESNAYNNLSGILLKRDEIAAATEMIEKSLIIKKATGDIRGYAFALYGRGKVYAKKNMYIEAEHDYLEAFATHLEMGERLGLGMTYYKLGSLYLQMGRLREAKKVLKDGIEFSNQYNIVIIKFKCDYQLYTIYKLENNPAKSLEYLEKYLKQKESVINTQTLKVIENYENITRMKNLEKEAELQREKAEILEKKNMAEETARIRQEFLSTMSHEIRTPLNAITTIVSLLGEKSDAEEKKLLDSLQFSSNNLLHIINDILDFTKLDIGKAKLEPRSVNFRKLMENIWRTYDGLASEKGIKLSLKTDIALAESYEVDETKLTQILANLISNAIKFTEKGKVDIEIDLIRKADKEDRVLFKISDTGEGVAENQLQEIFESFSQTKPITTRKQGGTGLGLAIVKKLVALHGGVIELKSKIGEGSSFYFELNLRKSIIPEKPTQHLYSQLNGKCALLAEDNEINAFIISKLLSKWGVKTDHVINGRDALEKSQDFVYDFILMDIHMPEMNGFESAKCIRQSAGINANTPIFALTADITAQNEKDHAEYFNGFLWKPLQIDNLFEALSSIQ